LILFSRGLHDLLPFSDTGNGRDAIIGIGTNILAFMQAKGEAGKAAAS
jgi:hypothetical protein